jgi:thiamine-monophosphate kinase
MGRSGGWRERELIEWLGTLLEGRKARPVVDVGDDAAVVATPSGDAVILTTDCVVDGVHFRLGECGPTAAGRKAVMRAASDVAAMAGRPEWVLAGLMMPGGTDARVAKGLCRGMKRACERLGAELVGGDVSRTGGPLSAVVTVVGRPGPGGVVRRSGARAGDAVCVTGRLGGSVLGRHLRVRPRVAEGLELAEKWAPHALIDISDGLSTDAWNLARASGVALVLEAARVPCSAAARRAGAEDGRGPLAHALGDGEDYELLFTVGSAGAAGLVAAGLAGTRVHHIGEVRSGSGVVLRAADGREEVLAAGGWEHRF